MAKIYVGIGHGGTDPGAVSGNIKEAELNLAIGKATAAELKRLGHTVKISRETNVSKTIDQKASEANAMKADVCIEIHNNAGGGDGFEALYKTAAAYQIKSKELASMIADTVKSVTGQNLRNPATKTKIMSDGRDYFGMLRMPNCPAVLVECAFVDSKDVQIVDTAAEQEVMGKAIAKGVQAALVKWGLATSTKEPTTWECKQKIQDRCKFSEPAKVWDVMDTHPQAAALYKKWAESYNV